jgi:hypothetical protein
MKLATIIATAALAILAVSAFAQSNQSLTRAEVNDELVQVERAGYTPSMDRTTYPAEIQAVEAKVAAERPRLRRHCRRLVGIGQLPPRTYWQQCRDTGIPRPLSKTEHR